MPRRIRPIGPGLATAAPSVDGVTWHDYEADLEPRVEALAERVHRGAYRPQPSRRTYIPKADGKQRPLDRRPGRQDRPGRNRHGAQCCLRKRLLRLLVRVPTRARATRCAGRAIDGDQDTEGELDTYADIQNFFGAVSQSWLVRFLEHRVGDKRIIRLIQKWLEAGILEDGIVTVDDRGTGQGSVISPLLANIYLHYCFDLWAERWRRREAKAT